MPPKREQKIFYKVVEKGTRHCSNWAIFKDTHQYKQMSNYGIRRLREELGDLAPRYLKGKTIKANPKTVGILVFEEEPTAGRFLRSYHALRKRGTIIRVKHTGVKVKKVREIVISCGDSPGLLALSIKDKLEGRFYKAPDLKMVGLDKVLVLD